MTYQRVLPRDLFNEAKLLKCLGVLVLKIEDGLLPELEYELVGDRFRIEQSQADGSLSVFNLVFTTTTKGGRRIDFCTPYNSRANYPLEFLAEGDDDTDTVFDEDGYLTDAFRTVLKGETL